VVAQWHKSLTSVLLACVAARLLKSRSNSRLRWLVSTCRSRKCITVLTDRPIDILTDACFAPKKQYLPSSSNWRLVVTPVNVGQYAICIVF